MEDPAKKVDILVVEDEDNIAIALNFLLTREGYTHRRLDTGTGAVELIRQTKPDLVLLDVMLPGVSGYDICQSVRADPQCSNVRILMMTARGSAAEWRKGIALGADAFISKPFELDQLRRELRRLLAAAPDGPSAEGDADA